jgi:hypothetical protein
MNIGLQAVGGRDHGCRAFVDSVDDLGVVDPAEVDRGDREVGMPELPLDDDQRHSFARHLDRVGVSELMRRKASSYSSSAAAWCSCERTPAGAQARPQVGPRSTQNNAPTGIAARNRSHGVSCSHAQRSIPTRGACRLFRGGSGSRRG